MEDYSVSDAAGALLPSRGGYFKMQELALSELLECPLCFEPLDESAKVLPCQHTFCVSCLQRQEGAHPQLLCPECGAPAPARTAEELPANLLLVRILGGLRGSPGGPGGDRRASRYMAPLAMEGLEVREGHQQLGSQHREKQGHNELALRASMRNQRSDAPAEQMPPMQSQPPALCRALYDFNPEESNLEDSKYGLSFSKV